MRELKYINDVPSENALTRVLRLHTRHVLRRRKESTQGKKQILNAVRITRIALVTFFCLRKAPLDDLCDLLISLTCEDWFRNEQIRTV